MKSDVENQDLLKVFYELSSSKKFLYEEVFFDFKNIQLNEDLVNKKYSSYSFLKEFKKFEKTNDVRSSNKERVTLLYDEIEKIWQSINDKDDWSLFDNKLKSINKIL